MQQREGMLLVISGPSGVGKGTVCRQLAARDSNLNMSISCTTRAPRPTETEGVNYFFKSREAFEQMIAENAFLEYMQVFNTDYYGTPRGYVQQQLGAGRDIILEIDVKGAMCVRQKCPEAVLIFLAPPSMQVLARRLTGRGTESAEAVARRTREAAEEMAQMAQYDYIVINNVLSTAVEQVEKIIAAERLKACRQRMLIEAYQSFEEDNEP